VVERVGEVGALARRPGGGKQVVTESAIYDLGSPQLLRFAREHAALVRAIVAELQVRHVELPDE
jgi:hypothetical protein